MADMSNPMAPGPAALAEFVSLSKTYPGSFLYRRGIEAVRDVSFRVERGEALGLLGPNRAGKTTLIKVLLSLCRPTSGQVFRLGKPIDDRSTLARIGYVHENHAFPRYLSAAALLEYYGALTFVPYETLRQRVPHLLERFGLADRADEPIARFSKGMVQRLGMAQALINEPELLVLDEPTEGLDLIGRRQLQKVVGDVRARGGAVLLVSHVLTEVEQLCDRVAVMVDGRLAHLGPLADLLKSGAKEPRSLEQALHAIYTRPSS
jgi:ABC-2 type transport system ATP-binding protein